MRAVTNNLSVPINPYEDDTPVCGTAGCGKIAGYFLTNADFALDPCDDFYEFACGSYPLFNALPPNAALKHTISSTADSLMQKQRRLLSAPVGPDEPHWRRLVKLFFQRCMDEVVLETEGAADFVRAFQVPRSLSFGALLILASSSHVS